MTKRQRRLDAPTGREIRLLSLTGVEVRAAEEGKPIGFKGTAAVFNVRSRIGGRWGWIEQIAPGAFAESIGKDDIRMLKNHNSDLVLARNLAGNLRLAETDSALDVDADMTPTTYACDLAMSLEAGDVTQMSFGFETLADSWDTIDDEDDPDYGRTAFNELRTIEKVKLWEVSPVTFPAYADTDASLRMHDLQVVVRSLGLDDKRVQELAHEFRSTDSTVDPLTVIEAVRTAPATEPSSETPSERSRLKTAAALFPHLGGRS